MSIGELIKEIVKDNNAEMYSVVCEVISVNETDRAIVARPLNGNADIQSARLQASLGLDSGFVCVPKIGSSVIITFMNQFTGFVSLCSEIDYIKIDTDELIFNEGGNNGLVKVSELTDKINRLENKLNDLITKYNVHTHVASSFGAPTTPTPTPSQEVIIAPLTTQNDLENTKIKH